ncbi:MAG: isopenicillin N synthase family oxygenase [Alphaproteobacteria bacterium]|nr:isopenicillin N synthase family oxygenase [Alphaproteobacteria bacterium]
MPEHSIPIIDISPFDQGSGAEKQLIAEAVDTAYRTIGFLVVTGHGIPRADIDAALAAGRAFFDLPESEKRRFMSPGALQFLGYTAPFTRNLAATLGEERPPDLREIFTIGPGERFAPDFAGLPGAEDLYAPNLWPDRPQAFKAVHLRLYEQMESLAERIMRIFAVALDLSETYFADKIDRHFSPLGSFHYPGLTVPPEPGQLRCGAHTDFGGVTLLAMDGAGGNGGLQIRSPDGSWEDVTAGPGQFVLNIGDMMARWTNDRWTSTLHRVAVPSPDDAGVRRQSIGYFLHPNYDTEVRCLETCTSPGNPPRYRPVMAGPEMYKKLTTRIDGEANR